MRKREENVSRRGIARVKAFDLEKTAFQSEKFVLRWSLFAVRNWLLPLLFSLYLMIPEQNLFKARTKANVKQSQSGESR